MRINYHEVVPPNYDTMPNDDLANIPICGDDSAQGTQLNSHDEISYQAVDNATIL